jgi:hypothetical protein
MSSTSERARPPRSFLRRHLPTIATGLILVVAGAASLIGGCIRRVPAPSDDAPAQSPYSAIATWREVSLPALPDSGAAPLPRAALRFALGSEGSVWMDSALVDGRNEATVHEDYDSALEALRARSETIVILGTDSRLCGLEDALRLRMIVAAGTSRFSAEGKESRAKEETLLGIPLRSFCGGGQAPPERVPLEEPAD